MIGLPADFACFGEASKGGGVIQVLFSPPSLSPFSLSLSLLSHLFLSYFEPIFSFSPLLVYISDL